MKKVTAARAKNPPKTARAIIRLAEDLCGLVGGVAEPDGLLESVGLAPGGCDDDDGEPPVTGVFARQLESLLWATCIMSLLPPVPRPFASPTIKRRSVPDGTSSCHTIEVDPLEMFETCVDCPPGTTAMISTVP